jgi:hypothetical protein
MNRSLEEHPAGHETQDAAIGPLAFTALGLALMVAAVALIIYGILQYLEAHPATTARPNPMAAEDSQIPPAPRLEEHPAIEIQQLRAQEDLTLSTYGWMDKKTGIVRIPIERAMELQLERGFPTRKEQSKQ